jgi:hypothetical protein
MPRTVVGPLPTVQFHDGTRIAYTPPRDTLDNRWAACTSHPVACDCQEAEFAEARHEWRLTMREQEEVVDRVLAGHDQDTCRCHGCELATALHLWVIPAGDPS